MSKPDVIVVQPVHVDFPLFRYNLKRYRKYFGTIYLGMSRHHEKDDYTDFYTHEVAEDLGNTVIFETENQLVGDWRSNVVNQALKLSTSERVLFLEQDFLPRDARIFEVTSDPALDYNTFLYNENGRIHPAFCITDKSLVEMTSKDFAARPPLYDHFGRFYKELMEISRYIELHDLGLFRSEDFFHMAGLTNNYQRVREGVELYKPSEFLTYNRLCLKLPVRQDPEFKGLMEYIDKNYPLPILNEEVYRFFPVLS